MIQKQESTHGAGYYDVDQEGDGNDYHGRYNTNYPDYKHSECWMTVIFVQADNVDTAAVALYTKLSDRVETDISHFDIRI